MKDNAKVIEFRYLMVDTPSSYNIIMGCPTLNLLGVDLSTLYISIKCPPPNEWVRILQGD